MIVFAEIIKQHRAQTKMIGILNKNKNRTKQWKKKKNTGNHWNDTNYM